MQYFLSDPVIQTPTEVESGLCQGTVKLMFLLQYHRQFLLQLLIMMSSRISE